VRSTGAIPSRRKWRPLCHAVPAPAYGCFAPEIPDSEGGTESAEPRQASVPDLLVTKAKQTGATVTFIEDATLLESTGGVSAFLRWRT
jgi:peptide subunit release factor 1 (eRF1)